MFDEPTGVSVDIDTARCLNTRHDRAGCRRCQVACPTDAITIRGSLPLLLVDACVSCGACSPACPTDAIHVADAPERRLVDACDMNPAPALTIACVLHPSPGTWEPAGAPPGAIIRHGRCLASVSTEQLLVLTRDGRRSIDLDMSWCDQCSLGVAADSVISSAEQANALLSVIAGPREAVRLRGLPGSSDAPNAPGVGEIIDSRHLTHSRRGMFSALRRRAIEVADQSRAATPPPLRRTRGAVPARLPHSLPQSRQRLLQRLATIRTGTGVPAGPLPVTAESLPMAAVTIDASLCSGCELCARYCPTGAITFATSGEAPPASIPFTIGFRVEMCIDCGICAVACPEQAVSFEPSIDAGSLIEPTTATLASGELVACAACSLPTAAGTGQAQPLCFSCRLGNGVVTALRDDAGLMADLLGRIPPPDQR